jgi:hypothetical protein
MLVKRGSKPGIALSQILISIVAVSTLAVSPAVGRPNDGERAYRQYCAVCHGDDGSGNGLLRPEFRTPPTDLTAVGRKTGSFPRGELLRVIDQSKSVTAHGSRDLPIWGESFWRAAGEEEVDRSPQSRTMDDIVDFIETLQPVSPPAR